MEILLDDYKRRLETALNLLGTTSNNGGINDTKKLERIRTKISCYRTFIAELEREMANTKQTESNFAIPVVMPSALEKMTDEELGIAENQKLNEIEALRHALRKVENEQFYRKYPECREH